MTLPYPQPMPRPSVDDTTVLRMDEEIEEHTGMDPSYLAFEQKIDVLLTEMDELGETIEEKEKFIRKMG